MKKKILGLVFCLFLTALVVNAQGNKERINEKIEARKVAFITKKLELTTEEAQQFWPLYNEFEKEKQTITKQYRGNRSFNLMSDEELIVHINNQFEKEARLLALKKDYFTQMQSVLPIRKVAMLPRVEKRFKEWILEQIKNRRGKNR